jgi:hypothetical protein
MRIALAGFSSLGDVTSIPCEKDDRAVISRDSFASADESL